jgi:hypothetical protein
MAGEIATDRSASAPTASPHEATLVQNSAASSVLT